MSKYKKISELDDEELVNSIKKSIELYKSGIVIMEDISKKIKLNRIEIEILRKELNNRKIKIDWEENE